MIRSAVYLLLWISLGAMAVDSAPSLPPEIALPAVLGVSLFASTTMPINDSPATTSINRHSIDSTRSWPTPSDIPPSEIDSSFFEANPAPSRTDWRPRLESVRRSCESPTRPFRRMIFWSSG